MAQMGDAWHSGHAWGYWGEVCAWTEEAQEVLEEGSKYEGTSEAQHRQKHYKDSVYVLRWEG